MALKFLFWKGGNSCDLGGNYDVCCLILRFLNIDSVQLLFFIYLRHFDFVDGD